MDREQKRLTTSFATVVCRPASGSPHHTRGGEGRSNSSKTNMLGRQRKETTILLICEGSLRESWLVIWGCALQWGAPRPSAEGGRGVVIEASRDKSAVW